MAESNRTNLLKNIANKIPVANQQVAEGLKSAQDIQLKSQIGQARGPIAPAAAQQLGAQQTAQRGAASLQASQQTSQQLNQVGQLGLQQRGLEQQQQLGQQERQLNAKQRDLQTRLNSLSNEKKDELLDQQLEFRKDERGRLLLNDRQLADVAALNARSEEEFLNYQQSINQVYQRKIAMMEQAHNLLTQKLEQDFRTKEQRLNNEQAIQLTAQKQALEKKIAKEKADMANRQALGQGIGTIAGGALGSMAGPAGAMAGASAGSAVGGILGNVIS